LKLGEIGSTRLDDLWVETGPGVPVPELIQRQIGPSAQTAFGASLAEHTELKFAACLPVDLVAAVVVGRSLDEVNLRRLVAGELGAVVRLK
ncbi:MAG TPA: hypothetical protein VN205_10950, partial [Thermomonas sp.]|nr:hypothetical protein [Thermomonas sp.]